MWEKKQHIQYFLFSQYLADGIRITLEIILPALVFSHFGKIGYGLTMSIGALAVSLTDAPGPLEHKRNGMLYCILCTFLIALLTGFATSHIFLLGLLIVLSTFFFTMFSVFGNRAASLGTAVLLVMVLLMDKTRPPIEVLYNGLLILAGGVWYMVIALFFFRLYPYRPAQRLLGNCLHETAKFLRIKSTLYNIESDIDAEYKKLVAQQVIVNEKQDELRELLYKTRELVREPTDTGKLLMVTFADVVDLYEQIMATWYDYSLLREKFGHTGLLEEVSKIVQNIADEIDRIGLAIQSNIHYEKQYALLPALNALKSGIDALEDKVDSNLMLKKILVNLRDLGERAKELMNYFRAGSSIKKRNLRSELDYSKFVSHQVINKYVFINNLGLSSSVFRHSLRMMITCVVGFIIAKLLPNANHSYWILLTIIVILKPGFSLSRQRNFERFFGTVAGGLAGFTILYFIHDRTALFALMIFFMLGTYTFLRVNYRLTVIFMTPYILILLSMLGDGFVNVAEERLLDTAIGSVLSLMASYLLFPHWESAHLENYMLNVLKANLNYLKQLERIFSGAAGSLLEYKLVRKELYVSTANLSAAFQRMSSEPKSKQRNSTEIYEFMVLNHILSGNIAALSASLVNSNSGRYSKEVLLPVKKSIAILQQSLIKLDETANTEDPTSMTTEHINKYKTDAQVPEQLNFIYKVSCDIGKIADRIVNKVKQ